MTLYQRWRGRNLLVNKLIALLKHLLNAACWNGKAQGYRELFRAIFFERRVPARALLACRHSFFLDLFGLSCLPEVLGAARRLLTTHLLRPICFAIAETEAQPCSSKSHGLFLVRKRFCTSHCTISSCLVRNWNLTSVRVRGFYECSEILTRFRIGVPWNLSVLNLFCTPILQNLAWFPLFFDFSLSNGVRNLCSSRKGCWGHAHLPEGRGCARILKIWGCLKFILRTVCDFYLLYAIISSNCDVIQ